MRALSVDQPLGRAFPGLPFLPAQHTAVLVDGTGFGLLGCRLEESQKEAYVENQGGPLPRPGTKCRGLNRP